MNLIARLLGLGELDPMALLERCNQQATLLEQQAATLEQLEQQVAKLHGSEGRIQKRLRAQIQYWIEKRTRAPDIITQDELLPEIGTTYTLLDVKTQDGTPIMLGGNLNLVKLALGDVVEVALVCMDHKGDEARFFSQSDLRGPLDDPYFVLEPLVVTTGVKVVFRAVQGHSRSFTYSFYKW